MITVLTMRAFWDTLVARMLSWAYTNTICEECIKAKESVKPAYSTEMFEELVNGEKICVFASIITRVKYRVADEISIDLLEKLGNTMTVDELENIVLSGSSKLPYQFTITSKNMEVWREQKKKFYAENKNMKPQELKQQFAYYFNRFRKIKDERELKDMFKLKQSYMVKIL